MQTNLLLFSLLALSGSPLFCAEANEANNQLENALKSKARDCKFKRTGDTVLVTFKGETKTLTVNDTCETFFEKDNIGVHISREYPDIIARVFTKDTAHTVTKRDGIELLRKNHPILFSIRLLPEDVLTLMRLDAQLRAMKMHPGTALTDSDDDFS